VFTDDLGRISPPLGTIRLNGDTKLIVSPWAAMGTDALLITTGLATFAYVKPTLFKILGVVGASWGAIALTLETVKLLGGSSAVDADIIRQ
jgi:hypothetical protein